MGFRKILCPIDFSPTSESALQAAIRIAAKSEAELVIANVTHVPAIAFAEAIPFPVETIHLLAEDAKRGLATAEAQARSLGIERVSTRRMDGIPWAKLVDLLEEDPTFDLVVIGTHGRTGLSRVLLGSVAEKVVRHAPCSVLAVHERDELTAFDHILVPIDFSDSSHRAMELAGALLEPGGAGVVLFHAIELPVAYTGEPLMVDFLTDLDRRSASQLEAWAHELENKGAVEVVRRSRIGSPGAQVLAVLEADPTFKLVVIGSHGRTGLKRVLLGSVAEKVVRHAPCPVLVARRREV